MPFRPRKATGSLEHLSSEGSRAKRSESSNYSRCSSRDGLVREPSHQRGGSEEQEEEREEGGGERDGSALPAAGAVVSAGEDAVWGTKLPPWRRVSSKPQQECGSVCVCLLQVLHFCSEKEKPLVRGYLPHKQDLLRAAVQQPPRCSPPHLISIWFRSDKQCRARLRGKRRITSANVWMESCWSSSPNPRAVLTLPTSKKMFVISTKVVTIKENIHIYYNKIFFSLFLGKAFVLNDCFQQGSLMTKMVFSSL